MATRAAEARLPACGSRPLASAARITGRAPLVAEILLAYLSVRLAIRRGSITEALERIRARRLDRPASLLSPADAHAEALHLGRAVVRTLALVPADTRCLARSLVLTRLLARRRIEVTVVIGTCTAPAFGAHAWVEHDGVAVLAPGDGSFGRLAEL